MESVKLSFRKFPYSRSPFEVFSSIHEQYEYAYLLESVEGPEKLAQFSFIGFNPTAVIRVSNGIATTIEGEVNTCEKIQDPLAFLRHRIQPTSKLHEGLRFIGGAVGYVSYDAIRYWERMPQKTENADRFGDLEFGVYPDGLLYDHQKQVAYYFTTCEHRALAIEEILARTDDQSIHCSQPKTNISQDRFEKNVERTKEYIEAGDILQAVISKRYDFKIQGNLLAFYRALRMINPSPYMYFLKMGKRSIVGSSPEMLVKVTGRDVETFPIAGTRPRVEDPERNSSLGKELLADPKERAEHTMLVDLARNDLGRACEFGSVRVPEFMKVYQYSHVQHMVSQVTGRLRDGLDAFDAFRVVFPAGTVSGAPKVRAMEIIEELENERRGPYAGAVGYFSGNGNSDFAITIRTLVADGENASIQVGAGIVADSVPSTEWEETEHKARALFSALEAAEVEK